MTTNPLADALADWNDVRRWFHYPIEMPVTIAGQGPAIVGKDAAKITYEVWDVLLNSHASFDNLPDAINEAMRLNAALSGDLMPRSGHLALMAAGNEAAASAFMDAVWDALKADANDLRKQQRILEAYRALTTADQQAALDRVKREARAVKPLVWRENKETGGWYGIGLFGIRYQIQHDRHLADIGGKRPFQVYLDEDETLTVDYCGSLEAAKAAAQADYTARIHAALADGEPT